MKKYILTAGGTGGHMFPTSVISKKLKEKGHKTILITDKRGIKFINKNDFDKIYTIYASGINSVSFMQKIKALFLISIGCIQSFLILLFNRPKKIIGFGGYVTVPVIVMGKILFIQNIIHSADSVFGMANRFLSKFADVIATSFQTIKGVAIKHQNKIVYTGLPIKEKIISLSKNKKFEIKNKINILITGGSQAAKILGVNLAKSFAKLPTSKRKEIQITHQCISEDLKEITKIYKDANIKAQVKTFIKNMPESLKLAHLSIGRAGASTVMENTLMKIPAIYIPIIQVHQQGNIVDLVKNNCAIEILEQDFTDKNINNILTKTLKKTILDKMNKAYKNTNIKIGQNELIKIIEEDY